VNAAHAEASGERGDERSNDGECNQDDDQQGEAGEQSGRYRLKDRVDHSDKCVEEDHLALGR
jgi:hypothetical protein